MSLLVQTSGLAARRKAAANGLRPLAQSLVDDLAPLRSRDVYIPAQKALLSREGGRCRRDGTLLVFDPFQPHEHRCGRCGDVYRGEVHDRFWIYWYQLWLAERAVHAAALAALGVDHSLASLASDILDGYVERYDRYPNVDNVLGPTRLFFSTYLESIWLLQICVAVDLLAPSDDALAQRVKERIIAPSRAIISEYNEGGSNRQVWNAVALLAAARVLGDAAAARDAVNGAWGIAAHLDNGLLSDGTWFEGENYHLFAHRGLWYGVTMADVAGLEIDQRALARFQRGFATPFATALPDLTLPSRRDSQYKISLRQWRIAEHCELGFARDDDPVLGGALARLYGDPVPRADTGRSTSSADAERNAPPSSLTRADLSWRALLCARENLPPLEPIPPRSQLLDAQGIAVFRRNAGQAYVALDFGISGGGHGHPDRLNLLLADGPTRWLDDYGTGSYVDPSLHWYRSTLAHNAPLVDGKSQPPADGQLIAYDERGAAGWITATSEIARGVTATRTIVVFSEYMIDELSWRAERDVTLDLPFHADVALISPTPAFHSSSLIGSDGTEDGFRFVHDASVQLVTAGRVARAELQRGDRRLELWSHSPADAEWWRAVAHGPPGDGDRAFRVIRTRGAGGILRSVLCWNGDVADVAFENDIQITLKDGARHLHRSTAGGWQIELHAGSARSSIDLGGLVSEPEVAAGFDDRTRVERPASRVNDPIRVPEWPEAVELVLGESHYRRSEVSWAVAGAPAGTVSLSWRSDALHVEISVSKSDLTFAPADAVNPYDNEHPDINGDSVQLYLKGQDALAAWILVPDARSSAVRGRRIEGWAGAATIAATWSRSGDGYRIVADIRDVVPDGIDVLVNEMPRGRERRRGQLVLSGARGEFVYLRGDRHEVSHLLPLRLPDV